MIFGKQIEKTYLSQLYSRADDTGCVYYFSADDFEGLKKEPYRFTSSTGQQLCGYFYSYQDPYENRIVIFDHGMGGGHRSYMREIEMLARRGYLVFAYDHTGCMESGGASTNGFAQSLCDLNDAICALKSDEKYAKKKLSVVGHSWGAFSSLNISALHPDITHIVAMSGFVSVERILRQNFRGLLKGFYKRAYEIESSANPEFIKYSAEKSLKQSESKLLVIHSKDDKVVNSKLHFNFLRSELSERKNTEFLLLDQKGHNPNFTADAVKYKDKFFAELQKKLKSGKLSSAEQREAFVKIYDWWRMTAQDEAVWNKIFDFLLR